MSARLMRGAVSLLAGTALASVAVSAWAQTAPPVIIPSPGAIAIKRIVVSATRTRQSSFDVPVSIYGLSNLMSGK